jgi:hypothetical protein|tara:strand:+ start:93 stop:302 length:210 start_codon:yes stop_codon:yes gene_type:complete
MVDLQRKNELELVEIRGELKLLFQQIEVIKNNDLAHLKKSIEFITKLLWGVGFLILGQLAVGMRTALWG